MGWGAHGMSAPPNAVCALMSSCGSPHPHQHASAAGQTNNIHHRPQPSQMWSGSSLRRHNPGGGALPPRGVLGPCIGQAMGVGFTALWRPGGGALGTPLSLEGGGGFHPGKRPDVIGTPPAGPVDAMSNVGGAFFGALGHGTAAGGKPEAFTHRIPAFVTQEITGPDGVSFALGTGAGVGAASLAAGGVAITVTSESSGVGPVERLRQSGRWGRALASKLEKRFQNIICNV